MVLGAALRRLEERGEEKRAETEDDQPVRPVTRCEEHEREHDEHDRDAEQELRRGNAEPVRLGLPVLDLRLAGRGRIGAELRAARGQKRAPAGSAAPQAGQGSATCTDAFMPPFCPRLERA